MHTPRTAIALSVTLLWVVGSATAVICGTAGAAVDFSGHWVLESAKPARPGYDQFWFGTEAIVTQDASRLSIKRIGPLPQREVAFTLDGNESQNKYVVGGQPQVKDSRATWNGNSLLISTDTTTQDGRRWLSNILRWSLDPDGTLVVGDTEICGSGECPSVVTALRFRKQP